MGDKRNRAAPCPYVAAAESMPESELRALILGFAPGARFYRSSAPGELLCVELRGPIPRTMIAARMAALIMRPAPWGFGGRAAA